MRLLLDAHTFLWYILGRLQLSAGARTLLRNPANELFLSIASVWEAGIKVSTGKLALPEPLEAYFSEQMRLNSVSLMPVTLRVSPVLPRCRSIIGTRSTDAGRAEPRRRPPHHFG